MSPSSRIDLASVILAGLALLAVLEFHLLAALLAGLVVFEVVRSATPVLSRGTGLRRSVGRAIVLSLLAVLIGGALALGVLELVSLLTNGTESLAALLRKMAEVLETARVHLPGWAVQYLPESTEELESQLSQLLRAHAYQLQVIGRDVGEFIVHLLIGLVIGGLIAMSGASRESGPLALALRQRANRFDRAFRRVVGGQVRISLLNTVLTAIYLAGILPLLGIHLPLTKTMIALTFGVGLLPVVGNLISNTVIVIVSLSVSPVIAIVSLAFLIVIHKLEYFVNARLIGAQINARAWELLIAMVLMEAAFGIAGLVAAPIYYGYLKEELAGRKLI